MNFRFLIAASLLGLGACAPVLDEKRSTIVVNGGHYELRTRTVDGPNGPYEQSSVKVRNRYYTCLPNSPGDCEATVHLARSERSGDG